MLIVVVGLVLFSIFCVYIYVCSWLKNWKKRMKSSNTRLCVRFFVCLFVDTHVTILGGFLVVGLSFFRVCMYVYSVLLGAINRFNCLMLLNRIIMTVNTLWLTIVNGAVIVIGELGQEIMLKQIVEGGTLFG